MPKFRFLLVSQDQEFPLGQPIELADLDDARRHAKLAILRVFRGATDAHDWTRWRLSIRDQDGQELAQVPITGTLEEVGRASRGT